MFNSQSRLDKKTGVDDLDRFKYLQALVAEYQDTDSKDNKLQVLANIGNFAYDPINYEHFRRLNIIDLFLDVLAGETDEQMIEFAAGGICNCCIDPLNMASLTEGDGIQLIIKTLTSGREETVLSAVTTLYYLHSPDTKKAITSKVVVDLVRQFASGSSCDDRPRLKAVAQVFLKECIGSDMGS